jgi:Zn-dependent peptidase ImmA (M78 family)
MRWTQQLMREVAREERAELGLGPMDPLDPYVLAAAHGIPVYCLADCVDHGLPRRVFERFANEDTGSWSAMLLPLGTARIIVENDRHAPVRRRSNIAHELGHHLLEHPFDQVVLGEDHKRIFDEQQEKQATFMAGELLVPLKAAERMAFDGWGNDRVAARYGVSEQFAQMQMKGQRVRATRAVKKFNRA